MTPKDLARFWSKVDKAGDCWEWTAAKRSSGYGAFWLGEMQSAHRVAYRLTHGELPPVVRHTCDNPACVRPDHLRGGTVQDNADDMVSKGRQARGERNGTAKLTRELVRQIRYLYPRKGQAELGRIFGVSRDAVWSIVHGRRWAWLDFAQKGPENAREMRGAPDTPIIQRRASLGPWNAREGHS